MHCKDHLLHFAALLAGFLLTMLGGCGSRHGELTAGPPAPAGGDPLAVSLTLEAGLSELTALPVPDGVGAAVFAAIKNELSRVLTATGSQQFVQRPPGSAASAVSDLACLPLAGGTAEFTWTYRSQGDYNQDGLVGVSDLTPLGQHFGLESPGGAGQPFPTESTGAVIDGSDDGLIGLGDITPIGQNFMCAVDGYSLQTTTTPAVTSSWQQVSGVEFGTGAVPGGLHRLAFTLVLEEAVDGSWYRVAPTVDGDYGIPGNEVQYQRPGPQVAGVAPLSGRTGAVVAFSAEVTGTGSLSYSWDFGGGAVPNVSTDPEPMVTLQAPGSYAAELTVTDEIASTAYQFVLAVAANQRPIASLSADRTSGAPPLTVHFDASGSRDPDGEIVTYAWDWDGDGGWDYDSGGTAVAEHTYVAEDDYYATVRVSDDSGATDETALRIVVGQGCSVLVWFAADSSLADEAFGEIQELEKVGSTEAYTLLAGYDIDEGFLEEGQTGAEEVHFIKVVQDDDPDAIITDGDPHNVSFPPDGYDSADPRRLREFLDWADENFPCKSRVLVLWSHGDGWVPGVAYDKKPAGSPAVRRPAGVLNDASDGTGAKVTDNTGVLGALQGYHFDILVFCNCNMGDVETAHEFRHITDWLVMAEDSFYSDGVDFHTVLNRALADDPSAYELATYFVDSYVDKFIGHPSYVSMTVIDTSKVDVLTASLAAFAGEVESKAAAETIPFLDADYGSLTPRGGNATRDMLSFMDLYRSLTADANVKTRIDQVLADMYSARPYYRQNIENGTAGLAVFILKRCSADAPGFAMYESVPFNTDTGWLDMLRPIVTLPPSIELNWEPGDKLVIEWENCDVDEFELIIEDPDGNLGCPIQVDPLPEDILFSEDSANSGQPMEWAQLKPTAQHGVYKFYVEMWFHIGEPEDWYYCGAELQNSAGQVKHDFGDIKLREDDLFHVADMHYD